MANAAVPASRASSFLEIGHYLPNGLRYFIGTDTTTIDARLIAAEAKRALSAALYVPEFPCGLDALVPIHLHNDTSDYGWKKPIQKEYARER